MVMIVASGDDGYRLEGEDGATVGSLRRGIIRLGRFEDEAALLEAAPVLWRALEGALRMHFAGWPRYAPAPGTLGLAHDGAYEWVSDGKVPLARLVRVDAGTAGAHLALEYVLPSFASEGVAITVAQALARALESHLAPAAGARAAR